MSSSSFKIKKGMTLIPADITTLTAVEVGDVIVDSTDLNRLKYYNGSAWITPGSGGGGGNSFSDANFNLFSAASAGSVVYFQLDTPFANTTRTIHIPNSNVDLGDLSKCLFLDGTRSMQGYLAMGNNRIYELGAPIYGFDAATKQYVDDTFSAGQTFSPVSHAAYINGSGKLASLSTVSQTQLECLINIDVNIKSALTALQNASGTYNSGDGRVYFSDNFIVIKNSALPTKRMLFNCQNIPLGTAVNLYMAPKDVYLDIVPTLKAGTISIPSGQDYVDVPLTSGYAAATYTVNFSVENLLDSAPTIFALGHGVVTQKGTLSFRVTFEHSAPNGNFTLGWQTGGPVSINQ